MLTEKDYCDYDTCVALKELGYNDVTQFFFNKDEVRIPRIPLYEAQKWLREEKEVYVTVIPEYNDFRPVKGVKYRLEVAHWKDDEFGYETIEWLGLIGTMEGIESSGEYECRAVFWFDN